MSLGNLIGPLLCSLLSIWIGIRGLFIMSAVLMVANAVVVSRSLVNREEDKGGDLRVTASMLVIITKMPPDDFGR